MPQVKSRREGGEEGEEGGRRQKGRRWSMRQALPVWNSWWRTSLICFVHQHFSTPFLCLESFPPVADWISQSWHMLIPSHIFFLLLTLPLLTERWVLRSLWLSLGRWSVRALVNRVEACNEAMSLLSLGRKKQQALNAFSQGNLATMLYGSPCCWQRPGGDCPAFSPAKVFADS